MSDYEKVLSILPSKMDCGVWYPIQNMFQAMISDRGAYKLRRKVKKGAWVGYEVFSLTKKGGLKSVGFSAE